MNIWAVLGVQPGSDRETVRRAYARKLRITNPEDDPEGFKQLRQAYELAMRGADRRQVTADQEAPRGAAPDPDVGAGVGEAAIAQETSSSPEQAAMQAHADAMLAALQSSDPQRWRDAIAPLQDLLASPALDELELRRNFEHWLSHQIASHAPRSDCLIPDAIAFFGWDRVGYRIPSPAIAAILRRQDEQAQAEQIAHPDHPLHRGWIALATAKSPDWMLRLNALRPNLRRQVRALLLRIQAYPGLSYYLEPETVNWWRNYLARPHLHEAAMFFPICWLFSWAALIASRGGVAPTGIDAATATPLGLVLAVGYWRLARRRVVPALDEAQVNTLHWAWIVGLFASISGAIFLPALPWGLGLLTAAAAIVLLAQDLAIRLWPASSVVAGDDGRMLWPVFGAFIASVAMEADRLLQWLVVAAMILLGWYRGRDAIIIRLGRWPIWLNRALPWAAAAGLLAITALSSITDRVGPVYRASLYIALVLATLRVAVILEPNRLYRQFLGRGGWAALVLFWFCSMPSPQIPTQPQSPVQVPLAPQLPDPNFSKPPAPELAPPPPIIVCPSVAADKRAHPGRTQARECGSMSDWFRGVDYPPYVGKSNGTGITRISATIRTDGRVSGCHVMRSSGSEALDRITCRVIEDRARFLPARDEDGRALKSQFIGIMHWRMESERAPVQ